MADVALAPSTATAGTPFAGAAAWLLRSGSLGQGLMSVTAIYYGTLMMKIPEGKVGLFVTLAVAVAGGLTLIGERRTRSRLKALRALEREPLSPALLGQALKEVAAVPDAQFWVGLQHWVVGAASLATSFRVLSGSEDWGLFARIFSLGILFGPLASVMSTLLGLQRSRLLISRLARAGLAPAEVAQAFPPKRTQLRGRLIAFTAIAVLSPAVMTHQVATDLTRQGVARVLAAPPGVDQRALAQEVRTEAMAHIGLLLVLVFSLALGSAFLGGSALGSPMREIADEATRIAHGEMREVRVIPAEDEIWAVSSAFTAMHAHLGGVLSQLKTAGLRIGSTTEEIVATSGRYEAGATSQASALNETSATTEELARSAAQISDNASKVASMAERTLAAAQAGQSSATAFAGSLGRMRQDNEAIGQAVEKLNKRVQQIGKIVEFINSVADRSDLLALNADLEGTKAGEVGRGFSLVAAEMRRLAENVIESTKEIEGLIEEIREATRGAVSATEAGLAATLGGGGLASAVSSTLEAIVDLARKTSEAVRAISVATHQQQSGTDQLAGAMGDILRVTHENLEATRHVTSANADLSTLARELRAVVERFRLER